MGWPLTLGTVGFLLYVMLKAIAWSRQRTQELSASRQAVTP